MRIFNIKQISGIALLSLCSGVGFAKTTIYYNNFSGTGTGSNNALPPGTGLIETTPVPSVDAISDCQFTLGNGSLKSDCTINRSPPAGLTSLGVPGSLYSQFLAPFFSLANPNSPSTPLLVSTTDEVLTFEFKMGYEHDVTSPASISQAAYYQTDVNDGRLGWGFFAITSPNSPVNLCFGITANEIMAYVDGLSQTSSADTNPGFFHAAQKVLSQYKPGQKVDIKVRVDKVHKTGTYLVNGVKKLVVHLDGPIPAMGTTVTGATVLLPSLPRNNNPSLDGWSVVWLPASNQLYQGNLGAPDGRYTAGGLLDQQLYPAFLGAPQGYPATELKPYGDWANTLFHTNYKMTLYKMKIYSRGNDPNNDTNNGSDNGNNDDGSSDNGW